MLRSRIAALTGALAVACACVICCLAVTPALALTLTQDQLNATGSVSVTMSDSETHASVPGGQLSLYRVATVELNNADLSFALTPEFAASGVSLANVEDEDLALTLAQYAQANVLTATVQSISEAGTSRFGELPLGLYLIVQSTPAEGYSAVLPFLVTLPGQEGQSWVFDVDASPKVELSKRIPNQPPSEKPSSSLPQTGQLNWPVPVLAGVGLAFMLVGAVLLFSRRRRKASHR